MTSYSDKNENYRCYKITDVIVVHKTKDAFGELSNMAAGFPIVLNNELVLTSEALYQACRYPHLPEIQKQIIVQHSPMTAKMKSKQYIDESRKDWNSVRVPIMRWCLRVKLAQNFDKFSQILLSTEEHPIVELSRKDDFWGALIRGEEKDLLVGENVLGRLLMELRNKLKLYPKSRFESVSPLSIKDFLFLGIPIEVVTNTQINLPSQVKQYDLLS
ncbi:NADAR family protein [Shewanella sp. S23-S33]|uniref:NADAR family protein n=1 Tax=Shewanella sp. S23-S33 TaxID=3342769 RepID=UPI00372D6142